MSKKNPASISIYIYRLFLIAIFSLPYNQNIIFASSHDHEYIYDASELGEQFKKELAGKPFLVGVSTSEHQCSKKCTPEICDWSRYAQQNNLKQPTDPEYTLNLWENHKPYADQEKDKLHINAKRISIEWALVQPKGPDSFDKEALQHYADMVTYMIEKDITPMICFHHYTSPCWFADKNGFETINNCPYFATYASTTYDYIIKHIIAHPSTYQKWLDLEANNRGLLLATFNSPEGVAFKGYRQGEGPPSDPAKQGLYWVTLVLENMMEAHVQAYAAINNAHQNITKNIKSSNPNTQNIIIPKPKIGFLKNMMQFDPAPNLNMVSKAITAFTCAIATKLNDTSIFDFFRTGTFDSVIPFVTAPSLYNAKAPKSLDWIGCNNYSNTFMRLFSRVTPDPSDPNATDNTTYIINPDSLYRALSTLHEKLAKPLNIPIYVTENGIATNDSDKKNRFYKGYLHELLKAIKNGIPVLGYLTWTSGDNYEWPKTKDSNPLQGDNRKYGLMAPSKDGKTLILKKGAQYFIDYARALTAINNN